MNTYQEINKSNDASGASIINEDIDEILRGEISAIEAYDQVIMKLSEYPELFKLIEMRSEHENAVDFWKREVRDAGKIPETDSSLWGSLVEAFIGTSKLMGTETTLQALKKGEEYGLSNYRKMLDSDILKKSQKLKVREHFIPNQKKHIDSIDMLIKMQ